MFYFYVISQTLHILGYIFKKIIFISLKGVLFIFTEDNCTNNSSYYLLSFFNMPTTTLHLKYIITSSYNLGQVFISS